MAPFKALYGQKCRTPLFWNQTGETQVFGPDVLRDAEEKVRMIRDNLRVAQSRQNSYANTMRSGRRFSLKEKLAPMYIGPFKT